jgi:uncharacterized heparinase superfamily protein
MAPEILAGRIANGLVTYDYFLKTAPAADKGAFFRALADEARALHRAAIRLVAVPAMLRAAKALIAFGAAVPGGAPRLHAGLALLADGIALIKRDGSLPERAPSAQLAALRELVDIRAILRIAAFEPPPQLTEAIERVAPLLRFFRHADGGLAQFHGSVEEAPEAIDAALALSASRLGAPERAPQSGYERAEAGDSLLFFDAAPPPPPGHDAGGHAGTLAFEFGTGTGRLVTNCGAYRGADPAWRELGRTTAAHSTLVLSDRNSAKIVPGGGLARRPEQVRATRREESGHILLEASHDGYARRFGLIHKRSLYLSYNGGDLRGEDRLETTPNEDMPRRTIGATFTIRFHLHPDVAVGEAETDRFGNRTVEFGSDAAGPWRFATEPRHAVSVEESRYFGLGPQPRRTRQIVVTGHVPEAGSVVVKWAIKRAE